MGGHLDPDEPQCSISRSLELVGERWTFLIVREALGGTTRFSDFRDSLGIASDLLAQRLNTLVDAGVMEKELYKEPGRRGRHEYHLTPSGRELRIVLGALQQWGDRHHAPTGGPTAVRRSRATGRPLNVAFVDDAGQTVTVDDVEFVTTVAPVFDGN